MIFIRSSLGVKHKIKLSNGTGIIDADYYGNTDNEGHIFIAIENTGKDDFIINKGDRIAQGIFIKYYTVTDEEEIIDERKVDLDPLMEINMKLYDELKWRGLIEDISSPDIEKMLNEESITFYIGTDPTAKSLHIGHFSSFLSC